MRTTTEGVCNVDLVCSRAYFPEGVSWFLKDVQYAQMWSMYDSTKLCKYILETGHAWSIFIP
jgi:hypothetical protein